MTAIVSEAWDSDTFSLQRQTGRRELLYLIEECDSDDEAEAAALAVAPDPYKGLVIQDVNGKRVQARVWMVTVVYGDPRDEKSKDKPETGESTFSFDTTGATFRRQQSIATTRYPAAEEENAAPDFKGAINVQGDKVEGVDVVVGRIRYVETHFIATASVTAAYVKTLASLTGKINDASFKGFAAEEVLFAGATGNKRGNGDDWEIQFLFDIEVNETGLTVGPFTGIAKKGWSYIWTRYADDVDEEVFALIKDPIGVYVEQVYEKKSFAALGIGT